MLYGSAIEAIVVNHKQPEQRAKTEGKTEAIIWPELQRATMLSSS